MESNWAAEHLQVIRTLMERSALYRRALAPIMIYNGAVGTVAAIAGWSCKIDSLRGFILFWACVAVVAMGGSFFLVRRQALQASEPFWSPPTRRITQAMLPPLAAGMFIGLITYTNFALIRTLVFSVATAELGGVVRLRVPCRWFFYAPRHETFRMGICCRWLLFVLDRRSQSIGLRLWNHGSFLWRAAPGVWNLFVFH